MDEFVAPFAGAPRGHARHRQRAVPGALARPGRAARQSPTPFARRCSRSWVARRKRAHDDFGVDIEVEVNLASSAPSRAEQRTARRMRQPWQSPRPRVMPNVSRARDVRARSPQPVTSTPRQRRPKPPAPPIAGRVDLKDVLAKITEDDAPRWMVVKNGMDHGPFSGRQLVNMIVQGEAPARARAAEHRHRSPRQGRRVSPSSRSSWRSTSCAAPSSSRRAGARRASRPRRSTRPASSWARASPMVAVAALGGGIYAFSRSGAGSTVTRTPSSTCISAVRWRSPAPPASCRARAAARRSGGGGGGGAGGGMSYEDAMMQAVDIGSAHGARRAAARALGPWRA